MRKNWDDLDRFPAVVKTAASFPFRALTGITDMASAIRAGEVLLAAKAELGHGNWLPWLNANIPEISARSAQHFMRLAKNKTKLPAEIGVKRGIELLADEKGPRC